MPVLWIWKNDRQQKNAVVYENYDGKTETTTAKIYVMYQAYDGKTWLAYWQN